MQPTNLPFWVQIVKALGPMMIAVAALVVTSVITYRQWKTARDKLRLDLFDKRFAIYNATKQVIAGVMIHGNVGDKEIMDFLRATRGAEFLFDRSIIENFDQIRKRLNNVQFAEKQLSNENLTQGQRKKLVEESRVAKEFLESEFTVIEQKFSAYLSFEHLKD